MHAGPYGGVQDWIHRKPQIRPELCMPGPGHKKSGEDYLTLRAKRQVDGVA